MAESGCLKDGAFQNSEAENVIIAGLGTGRLRLGNSNQAAGVLTAKIDTGILNHPKIFTTPAPASSVATGVHTLTAVNFANGFITVTASSTTDAVTMPAKSVFVTLFGTDAKVGDSFIWYLHNASTTVNQRLTLTTATGAAVPANQQAFVAANSANQETATTGGTSTGQFMTRLTNVDGSTQTYRLS